MTDTLERAARIARDNADAPRLMAQGRRNAGKTELVRARVEGLLARGADPAGVCVVVAGDAAAQALADLAARGVRVTCARDLELQILSSEGGRAFTGRVPRLVMPFEDDFVKEDLKTTGVAAKQLKGMLGFFRKSLTTLEADDPHFFWEKDEQAVFNLARTCLAAYGPIHPCELAGMCAHYLETLDDPAAAAGVEHLVVDDYQALNRASQLVLEDLRPRSVWACADVADRAVGADPFPYPAGVEEFCGRGEGAVRVNLAAPGADGVRGAAALLAESGYLDALSLGLKDSRGEDEVRDSYDVPCAARPLPGVELLESPSWKDEFGRVAAYVRDRVVRGARPADVLVAAPNLTWARSLAKALKAAGLPVRRTAAGQLVSANFRHEELCAEARLVCLLALLANPEDGMAWRCWCGVGDAVARSNVFVELVTHDCAEGGSTLVQALESLAAAADEDGEGLGAAHRGVAEAYRAGRRALSELAGLTGRALVEGLAAQAGVRRMGEALLDALLAPGAQAGVAEMFASVHARATRGDFFGAPDGVAVCTYADAAGLAFDHVVLAGCMNGWLPAHAYFDAASASAKARQGMDAQARAAVYTLAGCARATLAVSSFADVDLEVSERLNLKGYRVGAGADGRRHMSVRRSVVADYALAAWGVIPLDEEDLRRQVSPY